MGSRWKHILSSGLVEQEEVGLVDAQMQRFILALVLIGSVVAVVLVALGTRLSPSGIALYTAPLSGLAGIAVGYYFGKDK